ncbi:MAG: response regulator [Pseudomonadota bacterium]
MQNSLRIDQMPISQFRNSVIQALLVDDNEFDRKYIKRLSTRSDLNIQIAEARSIEEMSQNLRSRRFDLVLLDYNLDDGDGIEALNLLRTDGFYNRTGVIMVTGDTKTEVAVNAFRNGCHDIVAKDGLSSDKMQAAILRSLAGAKATVFENGQDRLGISNVHDTAGLKNYLAGFEHDDDDPFLFRS